MVSGSLAASQFTSKFPNSDKPVYQDLGAPGAVPDCTGKQIGVCCRRIHKPRATMQLQSCKVVGFSLLLLSVFSLSKKVSRGQGDSQKPSGASTDQSSLFHALCGFQGNEVL